MGVLVTLPLYGNPGRELEEKKRIRPDDLRDLAQAVGERLFAAAAILEALNAAGWHATPGQFDLMLEHPKVKTTEQAESRLRALKMDPEAFMIVEEFDEE